MNVDEFYRLGYDTGKAEGIKEQRASTRKYQRRYYEQRKRAERFKAEVKRLKEEMKR